MPSDASAATAQPAYVLILVRRVVGPPANVCRPPVTTPLVTATEVVRAPRIPMPLHVLLDIAWAEHVLPHLAGMGLRKQGNNAMTLIPLTATAAAALAALKRLAMTGFFVP